MYWVVLSIILLAESWTVFIIGWYVCRLQPRSSANPMIRFPFYSWIRLFFLCYLVLPQTQGARILYQEYVNPFLTHHEREIEELIGHSHERAKVLGLQYFYKAIDLIRENLLGLPPQRPAPPPPSGPASYAQALLSRFNLPTAGATTTNDWYSALGSILSSVTSTGKSREAREEELSASGTLLQRQLSAMTGVEKAQYISTQREVLDYLRSTLAREEQAMNLDEPEDDLAYGAPLRKNRSDNSFDVVDDEDLGSRPVHRTTSRWTGWLGNNDHDIPSGTDHARATGSERY